MQPRTVPSAFLRPARARFFFLSVHVKFLYLEYLLRFPMPLNLRGFLRNYGSFRFGTPLRIDL